MPYAPRFRKLGATANGAYHTTVNNGYANAPQSQSYTIPVDLIYDEGVPITDTQYYSNPVDLKRVVLAQLVKTAGMAINIITYAKQIEAFFRNGDNFDKAKTHEKGAIVAGDITAAEIAEAVYGYDATKTGADPSSPTMKFIFANASLSDGIPEIGALTVPSDERQAFVTPKLDALMKSQYMQNASDVAARILGSGFINPFTNQEGNRIDSRTGACGMYDGVDIFMLNKVTLKFVEVALGISANSAAKSALEKMGGMIVYGAGTCRGIVGPQIIANPNTYYGGVYILPKMKVGVECLHGATVKMLVEGTWSEAEIAAMMNGITFTPIDGATVKGTTAGDGFNDGTTN